MFHLRSLRYPITAFTVTSLAVFCKTKKFSTCDEYASRKVYRDIIYSDSNEENVVIIRPEDSDEQWEIEKEKCSFCKHFLKSPCKEQFKSWSKCVDKAKEDGTDFVETCQAQTAALIECTSAHPEYFEQPENDESTDEDKEIEDIVDDIHSDDNDLAVVKKPDAPVEKSAKLD